MDLMEQCQAWNKNGEYQKIIDAIEALPQAARTPELDSELARAYNNIATPDSREYYEKAIELLQPHWEYFKDEHTWNFRMAYAYYYLDQEGPALRYFERALDARPGDGDTLEFIADCRTRLALPRFEKPFSERRAECWDIFEQNEAELRAMLDFEDHEAVGEELIGKCDEILSHAFGDINFEIGFNGKKYELILTPDGDRARLFELVYFRNRAPESLFEHWNFLVGRQASRNFELRVDDRDVPLAGKDVEVWVEKKGESTQNTEVSLTLYCEKILPLLRENESKAFWMLSTLNDQLLGEIPAMAYIDGFEIVETPKDEPGIFLDDLPRFLEAMGLDLKISPERFLEQSYVTYQTKANEDPDADWRMDIFAGSTRCSGLINAYIRNDGSLMDEFHRDGAVPGFICYPIGRFNGEENRGKAIIDFRDSLEAAVLKEAGADAVTFIGGATGVYCGYLDFIAWDLAKVLDAAVNFLDSCPVGWASFHTFRRDVSAVTLKSGPNEEDKVIIDETGK